MSYQSTAKSPGISSNLSGTEPEQLSSLLSTPSSHVKVEALGRQNMSFDCDFVSAGTISIGKCAYDGDIWFKRQTESDKYLFFIPIHGCALIQTGAGEIHSVPGVATIVDGRKHSGGRLCGSRKQFVMLIERRDLHSRLANMLGRAIGDKLDFRTDIDLTGGPGQVLRQFVETAHAGLSGSAPLRRAPLALANFSAALSSLILESIPHQFSEQISNISYSPTPRHVRKAVDFMHAHLSEPITIDDVAAICGVSTRVIQLGFKQFKQTTPMSYLHNIRLEAAHQHLLKSAPGLTVADIALKWGFVHMGRFAADYRKRFGKLPSETLRGLA